MVRLLADIDVSGATTLTSQVLIIYTELHRHKIRRNQPMLRSSRYCSISKRLAAGRSLRGTHARLVSGLAILLTGLVGPLGGRLVIGQTEVDPRQEYNVKAVYLYSFGRYVVWPDSSLNDGELFTIGTLGGDSFGGALDRIARQKKIGGKQIVIRRFESTADYQQCDILFLSKSVSAEEQSAAIKMIGTQPVLLVAESPGFAMRGGTINFFLHEGTVRFEINVNAAKRQGLSIDAKLLSLAELVKGT